MRRHRSLRHLSSAALAFAVLAFTPVLIRAQAPAYPNFVADAEVPIPTTDVLSSPRGLAVAPGGTVYIADSGNHRVLKISPSGVQTTVSFGNLNPALGTPSGVALDPSGNLYVTDTATNRVVKLPAGAVNGLPIITGLNAPTAIAVDASANLAILNSANNTITARRCCGQAVLFNTGSTTLEAPVALAYSNTGALYVGDRGTSSDQGALYLFPKFGGAATTIPLSSSPSNSYSTLAALATDAAGNLYLANTVLSNDLDTRGLWEIPAAGGPTLIVPTSSFFNLAAVALDSIGNVYLADATANTVNKLYYNNAGNFGSVSVGVVSSAVQLNFAFSSNVSIQSTRALTGGVVDKEYSAGGTSPYGPSYGSQPCKPGSGKIPAPTGYPAICTLVYRFQPTGTGGRPGAVQLNTSAGTATQFTWGKGISAQLALLNAAVTPKFTNMTISNIIVNATGTVLYFTANGGTYRVPATSSTPTLISPLSGQLAVNGAGDLFVFNAPTITKIPADGSANSTIHVPGLYNPQNFAMDYNGAFYITDLGAPNPDGEAGFGYVERVSSTGAASRVFPPGTLGGPTLIQSDYDGNIVLLDVNYQHIDSIEVGTGSYAEIDYSGDIGGPGGTFPINLAVDASGTALYWSQNDSGIGLVNSVPYSRQQGSCVFTSPCFLPLYTYPGYDDPSGFRVPFYSAAGPQALTAASNGKLYIVNGRGTGIFLIDRTFGTILPQAFSPSFGDPTQQGYVFNSGNRNLVFTDASNAFTQSGDSAAFTFSNSDALSCRPGTSVHPGDFCTFTVTDANPSAKPLAVDTLHFLTNAINKNTASFKISGPPAP